ncbi:glycosyltransferase [Geomonas subterranea]|uniref:glycosyltransferase n=1 Tax=Geomonas subterranea TaxID=2847989 RepID=UPI001CD3F9EE|nr:glycosyltransferase [Geomonas fuzhouensis]
MTQKTREEMQATGTCGSGRITVLQLGSPSGLYGAERWILALVRSLPPDRFDVWVGAVKDHPRDPVPLCEQAHSLGFKTVVFESRGRFSPSSLGQVRRFMQRNRIDIVHTHGYKTDLIGVIASLGTGCRVVSTPHGWTSDPDLKLRLYETLDRVIFPFCDAVAPLSEAMSRDLGRIPGVGRKLHLIENGVDLQEVEAVDRVEESMTRWKEEGSLIAGYIGRLIHGKGLETLFSALAGEGMGKWRLALVGDGPQREEFVTLAGRLGLGERVRFFGFRPDRLSFLRGFDTFVLPSESEGIPRCVMEAMAARVPVVASDIPGCRYLVEHGRTGLLFRTNDAAQLAHALQSLAADPELARRLGVAGYHHVTESFSGARMALQYGRLYEELVPAAKPER